MTGRSSTTDFPLGHSSRTIESMKAPSSCEVCYKMARASATPGVGSPRRSAALRPAGQTLCAISFERVQADATPPTGKVQFETKRSCTVEALQAGRGPSTGWVSLRLGEKEPYREPQSLEPA